MANRISVTEKRLVFKALHQAGCFTIPNPWDVGSARYLESLGFKALATTSAGFAWSAGQRDCGVSREAMLAHLREMVAATNVPLSADFENGFARDAEGVHESVRLAIETGVAGFSIEDASDDPTRPIFELETAVARLRAARAAVVACGGDTLLVGRAENFLHGKPDLQDTIARLRAYAEAGADCLYAPGLRTSDEIRAVVDALSPKPVNLLVGWASELTLKDVAALGVRRVSVGGALARAAWGGFQRAAKQLADEGRFDELAHAANGKELNTLFTA